jgi:hypothetical protein
VPARPGRCHHHHYLHPTVVLHRPNASQFSDSCSAWCLACRGLTNLEDTVHFWVHEVAMAPEQHGRCWWRSRR